MIWYQDKPITYLECFEHAVIIHNISGKCHFGSREAGPIWECQSYGPLDSTFMLTLPRIANVGPSGALYGQPMLIMPTRFIVEPTFVLYLPPYSRGVTHRGIAWASQVAHALMKPAFVLTLPHVAEVGHLGALHGLPSWGMSLWKPNFCYVCPYIAEMRPSGELHGQ